MKKIIIYTFGILLLMTACQKDPLENLNDPIDIAPTDTVLLTANFTNGAHPTSGKVQLIKDQNNNKSLVFENFKTDSGPDLRIYLAKDKNASQFVEIASTVNTGNFKIELPANADTDNQKFVLIWCKQFSVLFGHAELK